MGVVALWGAVYICALPVCSTLAVDKTQKSEVQLCICEEDTLIYASSIKLSPVNLFVDLIYSQI